jgi:hypothetical protein
MNADSRICFSLCWAAVLLAASVSGQETRRLYLSGHGKDDAVPWKFYCTAGPQSGYWTNLPVPSNWELFGFGTLHYQKEPTNMFEEQGRYQCDFTVPADWASSRVFLVFDGVMTDTHAELNGESAGPDHQGGFYRFKYEVTRRLKFDGANHLDVLVHKRSANASVNEAERRGDYWLFGGIFRPVYLEAVPAQFIERVAIDAGADGAFTMDAFANGVSREDAEMAIEAQVTDLEGRATGPPFSQEIIGGQTTLHARIPTPRQWTAETPNLYRVEVRLKHGNEILHRIVQRFGFRTMEVREGDGLYVNGRRVILKGADRHSAWPESGRCLSEAVHRLDLDVMKGMNMNAVRMSHYPPDEQFLDLCDELGLYVLDELGGWHWCYDTPTGRKLIEEMVTRDVNHPSILFWDNGNEGGWNTELDGDFARWDPQRRRVLHPWMTFNGVNTAHYLPYDRAGLACEGKAMLRDKNGKDLDDTNLTVKAIYMPTESLHGLYDGGAGAGMEDYWELMRRSKLLGGQFIWALLDEGLKRPETGQIDVAGNKAPDGIVGPHREKEASFYTIKEVWSPVVLTFAAMRTTERAGALFKVENRYSFTDTRQCRFTWQLRRFRGPAEAVPGHIVVAEGEALAPAIPPGGEGALNIELPVGFDLRQADALAVRVEDPAGRELWTTVQPLAGTNDFQKPVTDPAVGKAVATETVAEIEIRTGDLAVRISKQTGMLDGARRGGQFFSLTNGPRPAAGAATLTSLEKREDGADYVVTAKFDGNLSSVSWRVRANGWVQCAYTYVASGPQDFHGIAFDYPEPLVRKKKWLGDGPYRVWKNRLRGVTLDVWENDYNNTITGWRDWVYPEFKGCFANVRWVQLQTTEGVITAIPERPDQFVQVLTPEFPPTNFVAKTVVSLPQAGLAFLQAIPPIGSKFHSPRDSGPQGQPNLASGQYSGAVEFYFGRVEAR